MQYFLITPEVQDLVIQDKMSRMPRLLMEPKVCVCIKQVTLNLFWEELKKKSKTLLFLRF